MTTIETGRWLLVAITIAGLALAVPLVSAHGTDTATDDPHPYNVTDAPPYDGTAVEWEHWMETRVTEHAGLGSVEWTVAQMGVPIETMAAHMADGNHTVHGAGYGPHAGGYGMHDTDHARGYGGYGDGTPRSDTHGHGMAGRDHAC